MRNDDTDERRVDGKTLKGWRRVDISALVNKGEGATGVTEEPTRVEYAPPLLPAEDDDIPELPAELLELADEGNTAVTRSGDSGAPASSDGGDVREEDPGEGDKNVLRIKAGAFSLELEGDADFIHSVYDSVRQELLAKMAAATRQRSESAAPTPPPRDEAVELAAQATALPTRGNGYIWVYVCHDLYNKVHVVSRDTLGVSPLANVVDVRALSKVYVNRARLTQLESLIGTGKTLWSELTPEGRRRLRRGGL